LQQVLEPAATALRAGPAAPVASVARSIAHRLLPPEAYADPPDWLQPPQHLPFRRAIHALERYGGALLAQPVGSGKTWMALAVAQYFDRDGVTTVLAPATLLAHWRRTALSLERPIEVVSHARPSRGTLPAGDGMVIIDESHHFRNPLTRRYETVAPWLVGRRALLLTATPVVNRLDDLAAQLRLTIRDDVLSASGIGSLSLLLASGLGHPALADLVIA
ncbi:MAG TPA: SNF2-related protein, partial [Gaiellales bacterium]|nr:SNF2-related protein [Gaiellales bacterium]